MSLTTMTSRLDLGDRDVVERLPGHAAGEGAVADDGDDVPVLAADRVGLGQPVGVGQRGGGVGVLDDVVLGLGLARVAADAALLAQRVEVGGAAGEQLVDVGLVAGVEDDPVARGVEDPVDRQGQLDDAEVGAEVAAGAARTVRISRSRISAGQLVELLVERSRRSRGDAIDSRMSHGERVYCHAQVVGPRPPARGGCPARPARRAPARR